MIWITADDVIAIHSRVIEKSGGKANWRICLLLLLTVLLRSKIYCIGLNSIYMTTFKLSIT